MINYLPRTLILLVICCFSLPVFSQQQFTSYDDFPGIIKSYKPAYSNDYPSWAKMLYQEPVNFNDITRGFDAYIAGHPGEESAIIRYFINWRRTTESYALPNGTIVLPDADQYYRNLLKTQLTASTNIKAAQTTNSNWTFLGPRETFWLNESGSSTPPGSCPWQANVYSFDVAASDNNIIYCGTETGYVNKTTDKGFTWTLLGQNYPFGGSVTAIAVHPTNPDLVYAAAGNNVHKSSDGGVTWTPLLTVGNLFYADRLRIDPNNPQKILAASSNGVYISTNGGSTWSQKWTSPTYDIEIKPNDNTQIFALTKANGNFSIIISTDGGQTFQPQPGFPNNIVESSGGLLAVTAASPDILLAILLSANNTPYLVKGTLIAGNWNWSLQATGQTTAFPMDDGQGYFDLVLDVSPINPNVILVGTTTLFKSLNGGSAFSAVGGYAGNFSIHPDIQDIRMLPSGETWVSTDGGMNLTTDNFTNASNYFVRINGLIGSDMWGFDQGWNEDIVVGGRYHNGNTAIADFYQPKALRMGGAESPTGWVLQGKSRHVAFNDLGNGWILPQTAEKEPEGRFIFSKYPNMDEYGGRRGNMVFHPNYYGTIFLGEGTGFWKSTDMGITWDLLYNSPAEVRYLQISYHNPDVIYADIVNVGLCKSTDGGVSWVSKPSLTAPPNGSAYWKGKLFFAISPYDENVIYACLQNGTWSTDIGKVFKSTDGGDSWTDWSGSVSEYLKCIVIQPDITDHDIVYLFTSAISGNEAKVFYRKEGMTDWAAFDNNYPAGMAVNLALPFFRDAELRVAGNSGVWETPLLEQDFKPIVNPWIEKASYDCMLDTLYFDDHSILNHTGATWHWSINPAPAYFENPDIRNPRVVLGNPGSYDVSLTVSQNGQNYTKSITGMVTTTTCPSIYDCNNPGELPKNQWSLIYVDSEEPNDPGLAVMSFDNDPSTIWHTRWSTGDVPYPHEIQIALGSPYKISRFTYLTRQDGENGRIKDYQFFISEDSLNWGAPVKTGQFVNTNAPQTIAFDTAVTGRYFRLLALSEVNGNPWASAAEFTVVGCVNYPEGNETIAGDKNIAAFPVPTSGIVNVTLPSGNRFNYKIVSLGGQMIESGVIEKPSYTYPINMCDKSAGVYFVILTDNQGVIYRVKVVKK
ncbi:MAG: discoidin domain-containing protein [Bacteroidetes bacterium]|nr:discoidin domain-containing protein [Bacteroidota bacterium]